VQAATLGRRTAELHCALASDGKDPAFAPEPVRQRDVNAWRSAARRQAEAAFRALKRARKAVPESLAEAVDALLARRKECLALIDSLAGSKVESTKTRIHGDYHLGQVLFTGRDFQIIDFEGEPARSLAERRHKRSPLVDVAGMLRSFHYAAEMTLRSEAYASLQPESAGRLRPWASHWRETVSAAFLGSWLDEVGPARLLPESDEDLEALLHVHLLEKALYELAYELDNRPAWVDIPLRGVLDVLGPEPPTS
jgi:maltose alpha-D-glucosyltransferase/alpha-amylase